MKDIFDFAKQMELDGKAMYLEHMKKVQNPGIKRILNMLASEEQNHYEIFDAMQKKGKDILLKPIDLSEVKNVFQTMKDSGEDIDVSGDEVKFYEKAREIEKKSEELYRKKAEELSDDSMKQKVNDIADEEHRHMLIMQDMTRFMLNPRQWVEDAEFNNIEEY